MEQRIRVGRDEVVERFEKREDPRSEINRRHPLSSVVVMALMVVLAGANGPTAIARWAAMKEELLVKWLPLPHGVPGKDVVRRVLMTLQPDAFQACFASWLQSLREAPAAGVESPMLAIDGKTLRRSHDGRKGLGALHSVSVWASEFGLTPAQVATDEKSHEITAIPELLRLVDLSGAIITIDAMGTQTAIAAQIVEGGGHYVLALKGNPGTLHQAVIDEHVNSDFAETGARQHVTQEKGHGREEVRTDIPMPAPQSLPGFARWTGLRTIGLVGLTCLCDGKETTDIRYDLSSLPLGVKRFARAVRAHGGIENSCHWNLDVTDREDDPRIRDPHLRENFAWLNCFTLSLLKQHPRRDSLTMKRRCCGWNEDFLTEVLTGQTI